MPSQHILDSTFPVLQAIAEKQRWTMAVAVDEAVKWLAIGLDIDIAEPDKPAATTDGQPAEETQ